MDHDRRKRCVDNVLPSCGTCVRLNLVCKRDPVRDVALRTAAHAGISHQSTIGVAASPTIHTSIAPTVSGVIVFSPEERYAYRYYSSVLVYHLTVSERYNSFLSGTHASV